MSPVYDPDAGHQIADFLRARDPQDPTIFMRNKPTGEPLPMHEHDNKTGPSPAEIQRQLAAPFDPADIEWKAQAYRKGSPEGFLLAYVDARAVMDRLDAVLGVDGWQDEYRHEGGGVMCKLSLRIGGRWVSREDGSDESDIEGFKGGVSGALKRAAVRFGVGRYLYNLPQHPVTLNARGRYDGPKPKLPAWALPGATVTGPVAAVEKPIIQGAEAPVPMVPMNAPTFMYPPAGITPGPSAVGGGREVFDVPKGSPAPVVPRPPAKAPEALGGGAEQIMANWNYKDDPDVELPTNPPPPRGIGLLVTFGRFKGIPYRWLCQGSPDSTSRESRRGWLRWAATKERPDRVASELMMWLDTASNPLPFGGSGDDIPLDEALDMPSDDRAPWEGVE